jgi:pimeloyl-ACP methyl ester carboxylesterase
MIVAIAIVGLLVLVGVVDFVSARNDANTRILSYLPRLEKASTSQGVVSYLDRGDGEPVLVSHGFCGGFDQGFDLLAGEEHLYRIIAPSRFGYPGSEMPSDATVDGQARAFADLLDSLGVNRVYVLANSSGAAAAIRFALLYPQRTCGLILLGARYPVAERPAEQVAWIGPSEGRFTDVRVWLDSFRSRRELGLDRRNALRILPVSRRLQGILFDCSVSNTALVNHYEMYDLGKLSMPTLCIHARDDQIVPYARVALWSALIPDCTLMPLSDGDHWMLESRWDVDEVIRRFVYRLPL